MFDFHGTFRVLLHAANLRRGTDGFTSPPKEGVLRISSPLKIRRLRPGLNPQTWVLKASTLPLDHRYIVTFHEDFVVTFSVTILSSKRFEVFMKAACFCEILRWPEERDLSIFILASLW
jgi:hypothetical protein